jgi:hypothetical protein
MSHKCHEWHKSCQESSHWRGGYLGQEKGTSKTSCRGDILAACLKKGTVRPAAISKTARLKIDDGCRPSQIPLGRARQKTHLGPNTNVMGLLPVWYITSPACTNNSSMRSMNYWWRALPKALEPTRMTSIREQPPPRNLYTQYRLRVLVWQEPGLWQLQRLDSRTNS